MVDFLDEPVEGVQDNTFRQGVNPEPVAEPAPEPAAAPEPTPAPAAPEPEPDAPPVEPTWLSAPPPEPEPAPAPMAPPYVPEPQYPQVPPQQYAPRPAQPGRGLEHFVDDPDAYIDRLVSERLAQIEQNALAPLVQQQMAIGREFNSIRETTKQSAISKADAAIREAYKVFNDDSSFRSNPVLQERIQGTLAAIKASAVAAAEHGDFTPLNNLSTLGPDQAKATLAAARVMVGVGVPGNGPLQVQGAAVESSRAAVTDNNIELTAEQQEIARRFGGQEQNYAERMRQAIADQAKYNDFEG